MTTNPLRLFYLLLISLFSLVPSLPSLAQSGDLTASKRLKVGDKFPNLLFQKVANFNNATLRISDFKEKLIILDFWSINCTGCIRAFPELTALQNKFKNDLRIIMVTQNSADQVNDLRHRSKIAAAMNLPCILNDTVLTNLISIETYPTHVWIGQDGVIKFITESWNANEETIAQYLAGRNLDLPIKSENKDFVFPKDFSLMNSSYQANSQYSLFHSGKLTQLSELLPLPITDSTTNKIVGVRGVNMPRYYYFNLAYGELGKKSVSLNKLILTGTAVDLLPPSNNSEMNAFIEKDLMSYEMRLPVEKTDSVYQIMRDDLKRYTGITGNFDKREVDCWIFTKIKGFRQPVTKDPKSFCKFENNGETFIAQNTPAKTVAYWIDLENGSYKSRPVVCGIDKNELVNLQINCLLSDIKTVKKELQKQGYDLIPGKRILDVLVLSGR